MDPQLDQFQGYPVEVFYLAALIGVVLLLVRPRWALPFHRLWSGCASFPYGGFHPHPRSRENT